jgi:hypothetical protein
LNPPNKIDKNLSFFDKFNVRYIFNGSSSSTGKRFIIRLRQNNAGFPCISAIFFVSLHLVRPALFAYKAAPKAQSFMSFGDRRKTFARPPQDIAPPAATICHGRGKLVTCRLAPCKP